MIDGTFLRAVDRDYNTLIIMDHQQAGEAEAPVPSQPDACGPFYLSATHGHLSLAQLRDRAPWLEL